MIHFDQNEKLALEAELKLYELGYDTTEIQQGTGILTYDWSETLNDLKEKGVDVDSLDTEKFYGYSTKLNKEVTVSDYSSALLEMLGEAMRDEE